MKSIALVFSGLCCALIMLAWSRPAHADEAVAKCIVIEVATFGDRVHIHCGIPPNACVSIGGTGYCPGKLPYEYFAVETNSPMAASVVQSGLTALINNRMFEISYDDNAAENPAGCLQHDCRRILGVVIR